MSDTFGNAVESIDPSSPETSQKKLTLLAYGVLALPLCLAEIPIILYLPAFYAQELRLSAASVGVVFLLARLWDGMSDILVGWLSDRTRLRWGRRKPWVVAGAPFLMASTWFLCNPPRGASLLYLTMWAALFYTAFTAVKIPHLSWGTELATDYVERSRVTSFREAFTMAGNLFFVSMPLIFLADDAPLHQVLYLIAVTTLVTVPLTTAPLSLLVHDPRVSLRAEMPLIKEVAALLKDRILIRFLIARLTFATEEGISNSLLVFSFSVGLQLPNKLFWTIFILYVTTLVALPVTLRMARRFEKHHLIAAGLAIQGLVYGLLFLTPAGEFAPVATLYVLLGVANTAMLSMPTSILADIIDYGEEKFGERHSGAYVAADNLIYKIGMALGVGVSFGLLSLVNFDPSATTHTAADMRHIRVLGLGLPCLLNVLVAVLFLKHPITRSLQRRIREKINARNGGTIGEDAGDMAGPKGRESGMVTEVAAN